jgi:hypothetical protein
MTFGKNNNIGLGHTPAFNKHGYNYSINGVDVLTFPHGSAALDIILMEKFKAYIFHNHLVPNIVPGTCTHHT